MYVDGWRYVGPQDPSYGETMAQHRRYQEYEERKNNPIRTDRRMTSTELTQIVQRAPHKAANIITSWKSKVAAVEDNHLYPAEGKLIEAARLRDEALGQLQDLESQTAIAADVARKALKHERDAARPKVPTEEYRRIADRYRYLDGKGISLNDMVERYGDSPAELRVLQDESDAIGWGQDPSDPDAADGPQAKMEYKARSVYDGQYNARADKLARFDKGAYRVQVALAQARRALTQDERADEHALPAYESDMIEV